MASCPALDLQYALTADVCSLQDLLYAELDEFEPVAIHEHDHADGWRVFFCLRSQRDAAMERLTAAMGDRLLSVTALEIPDEDWARRSQQDLKAVQVGRIVVAPPWDVPRSLRPAVGDTRNAKDSASSVPASESCIPDPVSRIPQSGMVIVIEPSMAFGTGHHQSTRLCLALLQTREIAGRAAIDVGTGSGVLAIAAAKLGATHVRAIDTDPDAIQNARANVDRNGVAGTVEAHVADPVHEPLAPADLVTANLTGTLLSRHASELARLVRPGGVLIAAGFTLDEKDLVIDAFAPALTVIEAAEEDDWCGLVLIGRVSGVGCPPVRT